MLTEQQAYDNWQTVISASHRVQVDAAKLYQCLEGGISLPDTIRVEMQEHIAYLRSVVERMEHALNTLSV